MGNAKLQVLEYDDGGVVLVGAAIGKESNELFRKFQEDDRFWFAHADEQARPIRGPAVLALMYDVSST
jgi:hypothetical protein